MNNIKPCFKADLIPLLKRQLNLTKKPQLKIALEKLNPKSCTTGAKNQLVDQIAKQLYLQIIKFKQQYDGVNKALDYIKSWFKIQLGQIIKSIIYENFENLFKRQFKGIDNSKSLRNQKINQTIVPNVWTDQQNQEYPCICPKGPVNLCGSKLSQICYKCGKDFHFDCLWARGKQNKSIDSLPQCPSCFLINCIPHKKVQKVLFAGYLPTSKSNKIEYLLNFNVTEEMKSNKKLSLQARCMRIKSQADYNRYEITWPDNSIVLLNSKKITQFKLLSANSALKRRSDEEIILDKINTYCDEYESLVIQQKHEHDSALNKYEYASHFVMIFSVTMRTEDELMDKFNSNRLSIPESKQILKNYLSSNNSNDIQVQKLSVSLKCPMFFTKISIPVRSKHCSTHFQPFDLKNFLTISKSVGKGSAQKYKCPICKKRAYDLVVDQYLQDLMNSKNNGGHVAEITFKADGEPHFQEDIQSDAQSEEQNSKKGQKKNQGQSLEEIVQESSNKLKQNHHVAQPIDSGNLGINVDTQNQIIRNAKQSSNQNEIIMIDLQSDQQIDDSQKRIIIQLANKQKQLHDVNKIEKQRKPRMNIKGPIKRDHENGLSSENSLELFKKRVKKFDEKSINNLLNQKLNKNPVQNVVNKQINNKVGAQTNLSRQKDKQIVISNKQSTVKPIQPHPSIIYKNSVKLTTQIIDNLSGNPELMNKIISQTQPIKHVSFVPKINKESAKNIFQRLESNLQRAKPQSKQIIAFKVNELLGFQKKSPQNEPKSYLTLNQQKLDNKFQQQNQQIQIENKNITQRSQQLKKKPQENNQITEQQKEINPLQYKQIAINLIQISSDDDKQIALDKIKSANVELNKSRAKTTKRSKTPLKHNQYTMRAPAEKIMRKSLTSSQNDNKQNISEKQDKQKSTQAFNNSSYQIDNQQITKQKPIDDNNILNDKQKQNEENLANDQNEENKQFEDSFLSQEDQSGDSYSYFFQQNQSQQKQKQSQQIQSKDLNNLNDKQKNVERTKKREYIREINDILRQQTKKKIKQNINDIYNKKVNENNEICGIENIENDGNYDETIYEQSQSNIDEDKGIKKQKSSRLNKIRIIKKNKKVSEQKQVVGNNTFDNPIQLSDQQQVNKMQQDVQNSKGEQQNNKKQNNNYRSNHGVNNNSNNINQNSRQSIQLVKYQILHELQPQQKVASYQSQLKQLRQEMQKNRLVTQKLNQMCQVRGISEDDQKQFFQLIQEMNSLNNYQIFC